MHYLKQKCLKAFNLLRVASSTKWGTDEKTLLRLYHALIWFKQDYGSVVYGSACKSYLQILDPIQNHALCLCLCAFQTSPVSSLHVEANEMSLELRRRKLTAQYCLKMSADTSYPAVDSIVSKCFTAFFHRYPSQIRPLGFYVSFDLHAIHFTQKDIHVLPVVTPSHPPGPPWLYSKLLFDLSLNKHAKSDTSPEIFQSNILAVCDELSDYHHIYTDGSKMNNSAAAAAVICKEVKSLQLPHKASLFTAELVALNLTLDIVWRSRHKNSSYFQTLCLVYLLFRTCKVNQDTLWSSSKTIQHWQTLAKQFFFAGFLVTLVLKVMNKWMTWPKWHGTSFFYICSKISSQWFVSWRDISVINCGKLTGINVWAITPFCSALPWYYPLSSLCRRDTVVLQRLHTGHTRLSDSYLLMSSSCGCAFTVVHLLLECPLLHYC